MDFASFCAEQAAECVEAARLTENRGEAAELMGMADEWGRLAKEAPVSFEGWGRRFVAQAMTKAESETGRAPGRKTASSR